MIRAIEAHAHQRCIFRRGRAVKSEEIIRKVLDGYSLSTFMVPDPAIPNNAPRHSETYDLPYVVIKDRHFWAMSESRHLLIADGMPIANVSFCYTSAGDIFCSYRTEIELGLHVMPKSRYEVHEWRLRRNYRMIWDSDDGPPASVLGDEIEQGSKFTIAILDAEDIWNVHLVDLPMYYAETGAFELKTAVTTILKSFETRTPSARSSWKMKKSGICGPRAMWRQPILPVSRRSTV
jgi:hypothetical protein